jgi:hypothetical protein
MAQGDYLIQNQTFPSFRTDLNSTLEAINTSNSGTSRPSSAVAGTIWLDTTSATTPTLKFFDGNDDISLATLDYTANTVNWLDSTVIFDIVNDTTPQLGGDLDVNGNSLVSTSNGNITFTPNGTGKVVISGLSFPTADGTADQVLKTDGSGNLSFTDVSGVISWQSVQTTGFTAVKGNAYPCNTTSAGFTVTLPATPSAGDQVQLVDYAGTFDTNALFIDPNGEDIEGGTSNLQLTGEREGVILTYIDSTQGWIATSGINEGTDALEPIIFNVEYLIVAGGGGGAGNVGGGGGAGGLLTATPSLSSNNSYTVTVGAGGAGALANASQGNNSLLSGAGLTTVTAIGGGFGANSFVGRNGGSGGSGGGGARYNSSFTPGSGTVGQGTDGGSVASGQGGGGGGGASVAGTSSAGGAGGNGTASSITGSSVTYAGGGGGGANGVGGAGGSGGGGAGSADSGSGGTAGTVNTGGGGGGAWNISRVGGAGGSGIVILKYPDRFTITNPGGGLTSSTASAGGFKVTSFTAGTGNILFS